MVWEWMQTKAPITEKAKKRCHDVRLELLNESWERRVFFREINMYCDGQLAWYARTVIPEKTYELRAEKFKKLKTQPLGNILYHDPKIIREDFVYAYLDSSQKEYQWAMKHYPISENKPEYLWARKSVFQINGNPLYLTEIFFPNQVLFGHV